MWNLLLNNKAVQSAIKYIGLILVALGFIKAVRKDAADDRENEIKAENAEETIKLVKEAKKAHEENNDISDDDLADRLS